MTENFKSFYSSPNFGWCQKHQTWMKILNKFKNIGPYSQHFIFFVTYERAQLARGFVLSRLF